MPAVIHSDQGQEVENNLMQEMCLLCGAHKTCTTPFHQASDGLVERFNRKLLMMLAMFVGEHRDDRDDLLPAVMMAYRSSMHKSTGFSPYRPMFREECTLPMDVGIPRRTHDVPDTTNNLYALCVCDVLEVAYDQVGRHAGQAVRGQKRLYDKRAVKRVCCWGLTTMVGTLSSCVPGVGVQLHPDSPVLMIHCQDLRKNPGPRGLVSWICMDSPVLLPMPIPPPPPPPVLWR